MKEIFIENAVGSIVYDCDPQDLDSDMLQVSLNGITIDVGWVPDSNPNGSYQIVVYCEYFDNKIISPIYLKCPHQTKLMVEKLIKDLS